MFVHDMHLQSDTEGTEDLLLERVPLERCVYQLALYAVHLASGSSIQCKSIKADTIRDYLLDVARFLGRANPRDPRKIDQFSRSLAEPINKVLQAVQKYEQVPNRQEPYTKEMWRHQQNRAAFDSPDTLHPALRDWFGLGLHLGFRQSEWAQEGCNYLHGNFERDIFGDARSFCLNDIEFFTGYMQPVPYTEALNLPPNTITRARIRFRTQKNGQHGEQITLHRGSSSSTCSSIDCLLRITQRFIDLVGPREDIPLAIYRDNRNDIRFITSAIITTAMRESATAVYGLHPTKDAAKLKKWTPHSLRIGACNILHAMGFSDTQIQKLLRWKSDSFTRYLRHLAILAQQQSDAVASMDKFPNYI